MGKKGESFATLFIALLVFIVLVGLCSEDENIITSGLTNNIEQDVITERGDFELTDWKWIKFTDEHIKISGVVKNVSSKALERPKINIIIYDNNNSEFLGTNYTYIRPNDLFEPGDIGSFSTYVNVPYQPSSIRIQYRIK